MLYHWVSSANVLTDFSGPLFKVKQLKALQIFATSATCPSTQQHYC